LPPGAGHAEGQGFGRYLIYISASSDVGGQKRFSFTMQVFSGQNNFSRF
jgi:hypothetical protein